MIRIGIAGLGTIGQAKLAFLGADPEFEVVGVVDPRLGRDRGPAGIAVYPDIDALVRDGGAQVVDICTPPSAHAGQVAEALTAGAHVICEKPLVTSTRSARIVERLARDHGRLVYPVQNYLFSPEFQLAERALTDGSLGQLTRLRFEVRRPTHARGVDGWHPDWRTVREIAGGGVLSDHGSHYLYLAPRLMAAPLRSLRCRTSLRSSPDAECGCESEAEVVLTTDHARCTITLSWLAADRTNLWELTGDNGTLTICNGQVRSHPADLWPALDLESMARTSTHDAWFRSMYSDFVAALSAVRSFGAVLRRGTAVVELLELAYASDASGGAEISLGSRVIGDGSDDDGSSQPEDWAWRAMSLRRE